MRIFGSDRMDGMLKTLGLKEGEAIIHPWINKALEKAQKKVEARFDIRKNLLKYDDVMNDQRKVIFDQRLELMDGESLSDTVAEMRQEVVDAMVARHIPTRRPMPTKWMRPASRRPRPSTSTSTCCGAVGQGRGHRRERHRASPRPPMPPRRIARRASATTSWPCRALSVPPDAGCAVA